ncbi:MAG: SBBP repeat-containing protein [bacterium]
MKGLRLKFKLGAFTIGMLPLLLAISSSYSQDIDVPAAAKAIQNKATKSALPPHEKKLQGDLHEALKRMKSAGITRANARQQNVKARFSTPLLEVDDQGRFLVNVRTSDITPALRADLKRLGFELIASTDNLKVTPNHQMITGWIHFDRLLDIARLSSIFHVRPADKPVVLTGGVTSAGDGVLRADQARGNFGVDGSGQIVGIISDGVSHLSASQASNDLPGTVNVINNRFGGDEGTAMLEIVHDLAPGAGLAFADFGMSQVDFANNINLLRQAGCTVISDDIIYFLEPVYEDGIIAQTVNDVVNNHDVVYTSSAGNQHLDHYEADFVSPDADGFHDFAVGDETMNVNLGAAATIRVVLQWNNQFGKSLDDYDLYLYDATLSAILAAGENIQDGNDDPAELLAYTNPNAFAITVHLVVSKFAGAARNFSIYTFGGGVTPTQYAGGGGAIYGHAAAQGCLAVGAIDASDPGNDNIESFSSRGPSRIYSYDALGNPISFVDRAKPEHAAIDGVQTKTGQLGWFGNPFFGTSAATPHTAGVAALIRQAGSSLTAVEVAQILNDTAADLGAAGFDYLFGNGRIDAVQALTPRTAWVARYNGPANAGDEANALALDAAGNVHVTGHSLGTGGNRDYLTLKYNTAGVRQWSARFNAPANNVDEAKDIAVDASGNAYVAGFSHGANGNPDYLTVKHNSAGVRQWTARYNGPGNGDDKINALSIDAAGSVFVTGSSLGANGNPDYATLKYNSAGVRQWVKRYNAVANNEDEAKDLAVDASGNVYVTGNSFGANGNHDFFTIKYNNAGVQQWVGRYNGPGNGDDKANALAIDNAGNVYVTGHSMGLSGTPDYATIKYNTAGVQQWLARYNATNNHDEARDIAVDGSGNVFVTGFSYGASGNHDHVTIKYNSAGVQQWVGRYNGPGNGDDQANALALDGAGTVYATGRSFSTLGMQDYATIAYNSAGVRVWVARFNAPANNTDEARDIAVDAFGNICVSGYSLAANGQADYVTIKYSISSATANNAQIANTENEILDEDEGENHRVVDKNNAAPADFALLQNYPNPFNPTTTIHFTLPVASKVKVTIYNVNGELVRKFMEGDLPPGYHELTFAAGDLSSGVYFYRLDAGDFTASRRMILTK